MCGITGLLSGRQERALGDAVLRMNNAIVHRGPDSSGIWQDEQCGVALGHQRLSIVDLSPAGHQPLASPCGRFVLVFNGEIYNHVDLRVCLEREAGAGIAWRGHSDTETLIHAFSAWGVAKTLKACSGMFAIALWDRQKKCLVLARDRFGEKPLYYGWVAGAFTFASELKALTRAPGWQGRLNNAVLEDYLRVGCVGGGACIYEDVYKLRQGELLRITLSGVCKRSLPQPEVWWSAVEAAQKSQADVASSLGTGLEQVESALTASVGRQMAADVPLGAFLSGGVDSSLIVALMQTQATTPVRTFSVGFDDPRYDESGHAEAVAAHLGTEHTTLRASASMALDLVPRLPELYDEPFADSSQLPSCLIANLTRKHVTVALSGDAGDELFGGYNRYIWAPRLWSRTGNLPLPVRRGLASALKMVSSTGYDRIMAMASRIMPLRYQIRTFGEKVYKLAEVLGCASEAELFRDLASLNRAPEQLLAKELRSRSHEADTAGVLLPSLQAFSHVEWMMLMDTLGFMVDDVLVKVDRASMASSLEVRAPFLDPDVFRSAWQLPLEAKIREGEGKWVLRQLLYKHVPRALIERPKMGFAVPLDDWLRGPLREWAEDLLSSRSLAAVPALDGAVIRGLWQRHLACKGHHAQQLWVVLQLVSWTRRWLLD